MVVQAQRMTVDQFDAWAERPENADLLFEFIGGEVVEVPSNAHASKIAYRIGGPLFTFVEQHDLGHVTGEAGGYMVSGERYAPDVAFIAKARQPELAQSGYNPLPPDLATEVDLSSTSEARRQLWFKIANYLAAGTVVWVAYPEKKEVEVYVPGQPVKILGVGDTLDGAPVLPGFSMVIKNVFRD